MNKRNSQTTFSQRQLRVGELVREALIDSLARSNIRDPLLIETSITISEVRMTPDLKQAREHMGIKYNGGHGQPVSDNPKPMGATAGGKNNNDTEMVFDFIFKYIKSKLMKG